MTTRRNLMAAALLLALGLAATACYTPTGPIGFTPMEPVEMNLMDHFLSPDRSVRVAALDYDVEDLSDPNLLIRYARADLLVLNPEQFWEGNEDISLIRQMNPDIKIVAYFRTKCIRSAWGDLIKPQPSYTDQLYLTALPHLVYTTEGDTASDWAGTYLYDFTDPGVRAEMLDIFVHFQQTSANQFDGVFWDYFSPTLWIPYNLAGVEGDPDMDGDGVPHRDDADELQRFVDAQDDWIDEMRAAMGESFIQIANGVRALRDSTFAAKVDGMFYEDFPNQGFNGADPFAMAMDPAQFNNLFTARNWPRTQNGGPWLILSQKDAAGTIFGPYPDYTPIVIDSDYLCSAVALLTDATSIVYEGTGTREAGLPEVEYNLGQPLGGVTIDGDFYSRDFENGRIELRMRTGDYPFPFDYTVYQGGVVLQRSPYPVLVP